MEAGGVGIKKVVRTGGVVPPYLILTEVQNRLHCNVPRDCIMPPHHILLILLQSHPLHFLLQGGYCHLPSRLRHGFRPVIRQDTLCWTPPEPGPCGVRLEKDK